MARALIAALALAALAVGGWAVVRPKALDAAVFAGISGDAARGAVPFALAGCANCHAAADTTADDAPVLAGGQRFVTAFGTFIAPNISTDLDQGIGGWTDLQIASAIMAGVDARGRHMYPAHPYTSYALAAPQDIADLIAYLRTLPADPTPSQPHDLAFPYQLRAGLGLWKARYLRDDWVMAAADEQIMQGRALVEGLGHCGQCHSPRDAFGGLDRTNWLRGAPNPNGTGRIPALTPDQLTWRAQDIAAYLASGLTPDFDSAGGSMAAVVRGTARLSDADRDAIAAYLIALR